MEGAEFVLAGLALGVGVFLAWGSGPVVRIVLFASALVVSAMLFLPGSQLTSIVGKDAISAMDAMVADSHWSLSDWLHFLIFVWLGLLVWLGRADLRGWKAWGVIAVLAVAAEVAQGLSPERSPRVDDVFLNLAGGAFGLLAGFLVCACIMRRIDGAGCVDRGR